MKLSVAIDNLKRELGGSRSDEALDRLYRDRARVLAEGNIARAATEAGGTSRQSDARRPISSTIR